MHYVSLIIELLRGRPAVVFWLVALSQGALWTLLPAIFYSTPPGDVPMLLAIGHEFRLGSHLGPPLAFWLGEIAYKIAGAFGVYLLAQACVLTAYWAVFTLGRAIIGTRHAVLAILLMVSIGAFTILSPDFGPPVLAVPFWALALLHYWRAVGEDRRGYWFLLALDLGLLLLANYVGLMLLALIFIFTVATRRGRESLTFLEPWAALPLIAIVVFPHIAWLRDSHELVTVALNESAGGAPSFTSGARLVLALVAVHLGAGLLTALASGWPRRPRELAPIIERNPADRFGRAFIYFFALAPVIVAVAIASYIGRVGPLDHVGPLVLMSGLLVVLAAGNQVLLYRERVVSFAWLGLLALPPVLTMVAILVLPWTFGTDLKVSQPSGALGRFFSESFERRTGQPLPYVTGDTRIATLIALAAPSRPSVFFGIRPERSPWASAAEVREKGGIVVWPAEGASRAPPEPIKAQFPDLVPEVPRAFARAVQGLMPLMRLGWAFVRPRAEAPAQ